MKVVTKIFLESIYFLGVEIIHMALVFGISNYCNIAKRYCYIWFKVCQTPCYMLTMSALDFQIVLSRATALFCRFMKNKLYELLVKLSLIYTP